MKSCKTRVIIVLTHRMSKTDRSEKKNYDAKHSEDSRALLRDRFTNESIDTEGHICAPSHAYNYCSVQNVNCQYFIIFSCAVLDLLIQLHFERLCLPCLSKSRLSSLASAMITQILWFRREKSNVLKAKPSVNSSSSPWKVHQLLLDKHTWRDSIADRLELLWNDCFLCQE